MNVKTKRLSKTAEARQLLSDDVHTSTFLNAVEDYDTEHGKVRHYGARERNPENKMFGVRLPMSPVNWIEYETWTPNSVWSAGPESWRRLIKREDAGWRLLHNTLVADFDEFKVNKATGEIIGRQRSLDQLQAELPAGATFVPSTTPGNWSALWVLAEPITNDDKRILRAHMTLYGADPGYYDTTLSHNAVHRHFFPYADGRKTVWAPGYEEGSAPLVTMGDLYHPDYDFVHNSLKVKRVDAFNSVERAVWVSEYTEISQLDDLVQVMTGMGDGEGRNPTIMRYLSLRTRELRHSGVEVTYHMAMNIVEEGNALFAEPKSQEYLRYLVSKHLGYIKAATYGGKTSGANRRQKAIVDYNYLLTKMDQLKSLNTTLLLCTDTNSLTEEELVRAVEYTGRQKFGVSHLAYTIGWSEKSVRDLLKNGNRRNYPVY